MLTTIDAAGRIVIPKSLRTALGLVGGSEVNVTLHDGLIEIEPAAVDMQWEQSGRINYPVLPTVSALGDGDIRAAIEASRR
jgi:AbrB family looped-hinge helix DNA binding protein